MIFSYAFYLVFCSLGYQCTADHQRMDDFSSAAQVQYLVDDIGAKPHWKVVNDDLVYMYSYGECYKSRKEKYHDLMLWLEVKHGADCEDCVCWDE